MMVRRPLISLLGLHFFGLTSKYRISIFQQIHEIVFYGKGGYSWNDVYNMPIWLRNFTFKNIKEYYDNQNSNSDNEQTWMKGEAAQAAREQKSSLKRPKYKTGVSKK